MLKLDDPILEEDMNELAGNEELAGLLKGSTVFVTGATGLLGSQVIFALLGMNAVQGAGIRVVGMARSRDKVKKVFGEVEQDEALSFYFGEIEEPVLYEGGVDFVVHGASPTSSKFFVTNPVETILAAIRGTRHMLEFARDKGVRGMVYLSSLEVYGTPEEGREWIKEEDYGYLDPLSVRSSYSEGKRMVECLCVSFAKEYGVPVRMARLSQTFGAGVDYADGRVFAEFARCAVEGRDIVLHTQGNTVRSYCYAKDAGIYQKIEDYEKEIKREERLEEEQSRLEGYVMDLHERAGDEESLREGMEAFARQAETILREAEGQEGITELDIRDMQQIYKGIRFRTEIGRAHV